MNDQVQDENKLIARRREKLEQLRENGNAFPNDFRRDCMAGELHAEYGEKSAEALEALGLRVSIAGRMMSRRVMGKASFAHLQDMSGRMQLFVQRDALEEGVYNSQFKKWDIGDIIGAEGQLFKTKTGELSVKVDSVRLLTKALRPLPEKFHGLSDQEQRYRQRYVDLIMNEATRETFRTRTRIVQFIRHYLNARQFMEVETPMMQLIPGGAAARPFTTKHNALDMDLFLRIAPELYLKRLVVGGFERVYEINRNFRNEGLSTRHNPEFTMLEFYEAYADYHDLMDLTEDMLRKLCLEVLGSAEVSYQGETYDFGSPFQRMTVKGSILHFNPDIRPTELDDLEQARAIAGRLEIPLKDSYGLGKVQVEI
ncbi:MAG: lysine--tRNA ligase, partial [Pseudomonadota bacterium]